MLKILTFSTLYPNAMQRQHGIFVETRLRRLVESGRVEARVVAPVPWFPKWASFIGAYGPYARIPDREERHSIRIDHPRYLHLPKVGLAPAPYLMAVAAERAIRRIQDSGFDFDLIDAHYFYPDGVAAAIVARRIGKPVVITARGSDLTQIGQFRFPRRLIRWAARHADGIVTVCQALKDELMRIAGPVGLAADRVKVLRNGVDLELFRPTDRAEARAQVGARRLTLLSVGLLIPRKAHDVVIRALPLLPEADLLIVGQGPELQRLQDIARSLGVADRVRFCGAVEQQALRGYYNAADALILASSREGWANVLLEAMACGTRVVASDVWGTPEVVQELAAGSLVPFGDPAAIAAAVRGLVAQPIDRQATRAYAEQFSWDATTEGQIALFSEVLLRRKGGQPS